MATPKKAEETTGYEPYGPFTPGEMAVLLEAARIGLADAENFDALADQMDLADGCLVRVREKIQAYLG